MAERVGFEPTVRFPVRSLSRRVLSTTQSPLRRGRRLHFSRPVFSKAIETAETFTLFTRQTTGGKWLASGGKEILKKGGGFLGEKPGGYLGAMIQFGRSQKFEAGVERAAFWIIGAVNDATNTRLNDGAGTHGARLEGDVKSGVREAVVAEKMRAFANHHNFGVGGGVVVADGAVAGAREDGGIVNKDRANGNLSRVRGSLCFSESELHEMQIVRHGRGPE